jgi:tellurite resistance protein TerC
LESTTVWLVTVGVLSIVIAFDLVMAILRRDKETTITESSIWTVVYVSAAIIFGILMPNWVESPTARPEFFAGWLTEYALSVDNIFVFVIILARLKIDSKKQQLVLLLGIIIALLLRGGFIAAGAAIISRFQSVFFIFGAFLIFTAIQLIRESGHDEEVKESRVETYLKSKGASTFAIALISLGVTDLVFALDSIPAIFGITKDPYIVATTNIFALMGLRQLYFLLARLDRSLGFPLLRSFSNSRFHRVQDDFRGACTQLEFMTFAGIEIPHVPLAVSLGFIITALTITTVASLTATRKDGSEII